MALILNLDLSPAVNTYREFLLLLLLSEFLAEVFLNSFFTYLGYNRIYCETL